MFFKKQEEEILDNETVILTLDLKYVSDDEIVDTVHGIERELENLLPDNSELDGDEFGDGEATIYLYGQSADAIFDKIEDTLKKSDFESINVLLRYGSVTDMNAKERSFTL